MKRRLFLASAAAFMLSMLGCDPNGSLPEPKQTEQAKPKKSKIVVLRFHAHWCGPCRRDEAKVRELQKRGVEIIEIDIDKHPDLVQKYGVTSVPTYVLLKDGVEYKRTNYITVLIRLLMWLLPWLFA